MMNRAMFKKNEAAVMSRRIRKFTALAQRLLGASTLLAGEEIHLLINPISGCLKRCRTHRRMMRRLRRLADIDRNGSANRESGGIVRFERSEGSRNKTGSTDKMGARDDKGPPKFYFYETKNLNMACKLALEIAQNLSELHEGQLRLLVLAGGDGFHRGICSALMQEAPRLLQDIILFRLPMGTGNDSADAKTVEESLFILNTSRTTRKDALIEIQTSLGITLHACNTVCFGIDAFVCLLTNKMKKLLGASFIYRFFANVAVLLYELLHPLKEWNVTVFKADGEIERRQGRYLLNIFGRKGNTTYGGGMKVLPDRENYLLVHPLTLPEKIRLKPLFYRGAHRSLPAMEFFLSDRVEMSHDGSILMALDGEVVRLRPEDFPLVLRKIPDALTILH